MSKKTSSSSSSRQGVMERFQRFLDAEEQRQEHEDPRAVFEAVWSRARGALFVNGASTGRDTLDAIMTALWNGEDPTDAWEGPVNLLPPLSRQREVAMVDDGEFSLCGKRSAEVSPSGSTEPPSKRAKGKQRPSSKSSKTPAATKAAATADTEDATSEEAGVGQEGKAKAATKGSKAADPHDETTEQAAEADLPTMGFQLADGVSPQIRKDLFRVFHRAATKGRPPFRLAYPWSGVRLWYDPEKYPKVHLAHWRFWNSHRRTFWLCAIHPPLPAGNKQNYYRKQKMNACRARLQFLSGCIEAWGYVAFLKLLDEGNTQLLWLGGRPGRHSPNGTKENSGVDQDLAALYVQDPDRYRRRVKAALDSKKIDEDGFASVTELLDQTSALDPDKEAHSRLSDRALARVCSDLIAEKPFRDAWVPDTMKPAFKKLRNHPRILSISISDELHEPKVRAYKPKESKLPGFSPLQRSDKSYTALAPVKGGVVTFPPASVVQDTTEVVPDPQGSPTVSSKDLFGEDDSDSDDAPSGASDGEVVAEEGEEPSGAEEDSDEEESKPPPSAPTKVKRAQRTPETRSNSKST